MHNTKSDTEAATRQLGIIQQGIQNLVEAAFDEALADFSLDDEGGE